MSDLQVCTGDDVRPVVGYEGLYSVTRDGRVISHQRKRDALLSPCRCGAGYPQVGLCRGKYRRIYVHRLVCEAFHGPKPSPTHQVNHVNGIKDDNWAENLEWVTPSENVRHSYRTGLASNVGTRNSCARLTEGDVIEIRRRRRLGTSPKALGREYGIHHKHVNDLCSGRRWGHVPLETPAVVQPELAIAS